MCCKPMQVIYDGQPVPGVSGVLVEFDPDGRTGATLRIDRQQSVKVRGLIYSRTNSETHKRLRASMTKDGCELETWRRKHVWQIVGQW